jgi:hypothetical protein
LSIDQLKTLGNHPLVTIGGHTDSHPELSRMQQAEACNEIFVNKRFLEDLLCSGCRLQNRCYDPPWLRL